MAKQTVLVTGGAGYIGSHVCKVLADQDMIPICFDDFSVGLEKNVKWGPCIKGSLLNDEDLVKAFETHHPDSVIHLAARTDVRESFQCPNLYHEINIIGTVKLLQCMQRFNTKQVIFSSSAAVYGDPQQIPIEENDPKLPTSPYGKTKWIGEQLLQDYFYSDQISSVSFRFFNAAGAAPEEGIGEAHEPETHLIPLVLLTALGKRSSLTVFGQDHPTPDGTAIRDYVHVLDLATAHALAISYLKENPGTYAFNLGSGTGFSIREILHKADEITGEKIPVDYAARKKEPSILVANSSEARRALKWKPLYSNLETILETALKWHLLS